MKALLTKIHIPKTLKDFIPDLKEMHNVKTIFITRHNRDEEKTIQNNLFVVKF